jgi:hypothetical protein
MPKKLHKQLILDPLSIFGYDRLLSQAVIRQLSTRWFDQIKYSIKLRIEHAAWFPVGSVIRDHCINILKNIP